MEPNTVMLFVWIGLMVAFTVIEVVTVQLVTIWFAVGSLVALDRLCGSIRRLPAGNPAACQKGGQCQGAANQRGPVHRRDRPRDGGDQQ